MSTTPHNMPRCTHKKTHHKIKISKCGYCGEDFEQPQCRLNKFCKSWCARRYYSENYSGEGSGNWRHGIQGNGYRRVGKSTERKLEHRVVMEELLGRPLKKNEWVHHINGDKLDNRPENLIVVLPEAHFTNVECPYCAKHFLLK